MRRLRGVCVAILCLALFACSGTTFVYNRLDFILPWYMDDYVELDTQQDAYLDELLVPFLQWHRQEELPAYISLIENINARLDEPLTGADIAEIFGDFEAAWLRIESRGLSWLLDLGGQLTATQIADFVDVLWEQQEELQEKYLERDDEVFYEDSYDNLLDNMEEFLGRISAEQRDELRVAAKMLQRSDDAWLTERAEWIKDLSEALESGPDWEQAVRDAVQRRRDKPAPQYREIYMHNMTVIFDVVAAVLNRRSERQNQYLRNRLSEIVEELETLSLQGAA